MNFWCRTIGVVRSRFAEHLVNVRFTVAHTDARRVRTGCRHTASSSETFDPSQTLLFLDRYLLTLAGPLGVRHRGFNFVASPRFLPDSSQRQTVRIKRNQWMREHSATSVRIHRTGNQPGTQHFVDRLGPRATEVRCVEVQVPRLQRSLSRCLGWQIGNVGRRHLSLWVTQGIFDGPVQRNVAASEIVSLGPRCCLSDARRGASGENASRPERLGNPGHAAIPSGITSEILRRSGAT